ncbi:PHD finger protein-related [Ectocarpus siliculosus]|uniref:PHD finger protein-related n=1 Tax=Ectocarpus siliculosus TaxID=2880 RepID=D8LSA3_ECTSI|nr:PHD finger protein-related [Ectocarpus siliculosus]|eukprot:CBN75160.1 PHD finger protein-related [Ectocarpus siliculosus]
MTSIGQLDDRVQSISALIDSDIGEKSRTKKGAPKTRPQARATEGPVPDGWRTPEIRALEDQINSRIDLVLRMADEKWRLAQHAYDRLDVNIRRLDADLGRMETDLRRQGLIPPREVSATPPSRKRRRSGAEKTDEPDSDWLGLSLSERVDTASPWSVVN